MLPTQYKTLIDRIGHFRTNREFDLYPEDEEALRLLGVRFFISSESGPLYSRLLSSPHFRLVQPAGGSYRVFEYTRAQPAFGWEAQDSGHAVEIKLWQPETRLFDVRSKSGGHFRLTEQFYPGWTATIDHKETTIVRCHEAFRCVTIAPGEHVVEFRYRSFILRLLRP